MTALAPHEWWFPARPGYTVDGDTFDAIVDRARKDYSEWRIRPVGIDAPEKKAETMDQWRAARAFLSSWLLDGGGFGWPLRIHSLTGKPDNFGRFLCDVYRVHDGASLSEAMLISGHAQGWLR